MPAAANELQSPTELELVSPSSGSAPELQTTGSEKVQMKKQLGLVEGIAIILGVIFGSGKRQRRTRTTNQSANTIPSDRNFRIAKGCHPGSERRWNVTSDLGDLRLSVDDWGAVLC